MDENGQDILTEKSMGTKSSEKKNYTIKVTVKHTHGSKSTIKDDILKCDSCEYRCKKHITLIKQMNLKHGNHICNICILRCQNTKELKKRFDEGHSDAVNDSEKTNTNKKVEQDKCISMKEDISRCSKCGYILNTKDTTKDQGH